MYGPSIILAILEERHRQQMNEGRIRPGQAEKLARQMYNSLVKTGKLKPPVEPRPTIQVEQPGSLKTTKPPDSPVVPSSQIHNDIIRTSRNEIIPANPVETPMVPYEFPTPVTAEPTQKPRMIGTEVKEPLRIGKKPYEPIVRRVPQDIIPRPPRKPLAVEQARGGLPIQTPDFGSMYVHEIGKPLIADVNLARDFLGMSRLAQQFRIA